MRSLRFFATTALSLAAASALSGCGSDFVDPFGTTSSGGGSSMSTGSMGTGGEGSGGSGGSSSVCPNNAVKDNLLTSPSFEDTSAWSVMGASIDYPLANDCSFACGSRFGHVAVKEGGTTGTVTISQSLNRKVELGSVFTLNAHFIYTATYSPYFGVIVNAYPAGGSYVSGIADGKHLAISNVDVQINDPRRTGNGVQYNMYAGYDDKGVDTTFDCFALTYTPPAGVELLTNGWFNGAISDWTSANSSELTWSTQNGNCGDTNGAAHVKVPASSPNAEIRNAITGSWPVGTKFRFGGAVRPYEDANGKVSDFGLTLRLDYVTDNIPATEDFLNVDVPVDMATDEIWKPAVGEAVATRAVIKATIIQKGGNATNADQEYLADCFSLRAIAP